jgi:hypothetical protein
MLGMAHIDRGAHRARAPDHPHQRNQPDQHQREDQEQGVVKRDQHEPHADPQKDGIAIKDQDRHARHHDDHIEIAVEQRAAGGVGEEGVLRIDRDQRNLADEPRIKTPRKQFHQVDAQSIKKRGQQQQAEQGERKHHQRRRHCSIRNRADEQLDRNRRGQAQHADTHPVNDGDPVEIGFRLQDFEENTEEF